MILKCEMCDATINMDEAKFIRDPCVYYCPTCFMPKITKHRSWWVRFKDYLKLVFGD